MRVEDFYDYMRERELVRLRREAGAPWPWTEDEILRTYKFTNVKRAHDRTTREFRAWYDEHRLSPAPVQLLNCATARYFGRSEFVLAAGWQDTFRPDHLKALAGEWIAAKRPVFTGAYVVTNQGIRAPKQQVVVDVFLAGLWHRAHALWEFAYNTGEWRVLVYEMAKIPGFGGTGFMAKEVALDTMFTTFWQAPPRDLNTWCPAGPGARRGLNRVHGRRVRAAVSPGQALEEMLQLFGERGHHWPDDWVQLELHDIQFQLCEFDKYERVRLGEGRPRNLYRRTE